MILEKKGNILIKLSEFPIRTNEEEYSLKKSFPFFEKKQIP